MVKAVQVSAFFPGERGVISSSNREGGILEVRSVGIVSAVGILETERVSEAFGI